MLIQNPVPVQSLTHTLLAEKAIQLSVKRLDLVHSDVSGNKFFKLKYNVEKAIHEEKSTLLTFGGAFSNHIYATAEAANAEKLLSIGIIRGERTEPLNATLARAEQLGMQFHFIDRKSYRNKMEHEFLDSLKDKFGNFYLIPEGGTNELAIKGTQEILDLEDEQFTHVCSSIGTGGTFAGLYSSLANSQKALGFSSLKGDFIHQEITDLLQQHKLSSLGSYEIFTQYHFGGYAKYKKELIDFMWWFYESFDIVLDPIYTGKMAFGIWDLIQKDHFPSGSKIVMIHSGGLQGNAGFTERTGIKLPSLSA
ncbi:1-aminocyclopropane-1-carboxylate deaminase/D-cysteine desulfhydrase-like pyridoxal-dependent ACC family enzyme [Algoriphagus ratkowskyi]|uniref:1-aminocyclopropane-1-carboxylate deaminase/D-cysteine desulfhydrase-like pyridoxal-dependent ACC family enzyme n=1 Tax=Algoriphagus ratkowskyi TaxID=57028 RepID=A0A2W7R265_9BACT|nr:pyridoxal-phosphate dependent enzyme [Algoriphagus ratkowskyi]PZX54634.1 1-aminocyclopropane-1-carboxylate deaminase/D-cysteine desulfhydrase-like pyridoxal-dependent ACC family enzyme [Algoriphagus ratkowskyi]TXD76944.1 pyridoxal-phosphate dependent enzyme [Algoriphagus ratkowskyi]